MVGLVLEMEYLQMLTFIQTYRKNFEFKVLSSSRWGTVETLKHDCLTYNEEFGDFPIFRFQINYGLGASSLLDYVCQQNWKSKLAGIFKLICRPAAKRGL